MADTSVVVQLSAQDAELVAAWQRARRGPAGMTEELEKVKKRGQEAGQSIETSFKNIAGAVVGVTTVTGALLKISQLIGAEWRAILDRMKEAANRQVDVNQSFRRAAAVATDIPVNDVYERVIRGANGVDPKELFLSLEAGISAAGNLSQESVLKTVLATAKVAPYFDQESRTAAVTGSLMLQKGFGATPEQALAGVMQSFVAARTETPAEFAKTLAPAASQLRALGGGKDSYEFLMSELIAFGQRAGDPAGRRTATNYINMARQAKEEAVAAGLVDRSASLEESLGAVRGSPKIQAKLLGVFADKELGSSAAKMLADMKKHNKDMGGSLSTEGRTFVAAMETLQADQGAANLTAEERRSARAKILGLTPAAIAAIEGRNELVESSKYNAATDIARAGRQSTAVSELLDTPSAIKAQATADVFASLKKAGVGPFRRSLKYFAASTEQALSTDTDAGAADFLKGYSRELRGEISNRLDYGSEPGNLRAIESLGITLQKIEQTIKRLEGTLKVEIVKDARPDVPQQPAAARLSDR
jgi:hypothetical protein